jgi:hypothetical protein
VYILFASAASDLPANGISKRVSRDQYFAYGGLMLEKANAVNACPNE